MSATFFSQKNCCLLNGIFGYIAAGKAHFIEDIETDFDLKNATARWFKDNIRSIIQPIGSDIRYSKIKGGYYLTKPCKFNIEVSITAELI